MKKVILIAHPILSTTMPYRIEVNEVRFTETNCFDSRPTYQIHELKNTHLRETERFITPSITGFNEAKHKATCLKNRRKRKKRYKSR